MAGSTKHPRDHRDFRSTTPACWKGLAGRTRRSSGSRSRRLPRNARGRTAIPKRRSCGAAPWNWPREHLPPGDLRVATSVANLAVAERRAGDAPAAQRMIEEALALWDAGDRWIESLKPITFARSSTFHLRLQARHPGGYDRLPRERFRALAMEGRSILAARRNGLPDARDRLERWRRERPDGFDDRRKLLGAVLLIAPDGGA